MSEKFKHTYRGYLVDNHCPKPPVVTLENLDPAEWEKFIVESNINQMTVYTKDHWGYSYYDTALGCKHEGLGNRDWIAEIAPVLKKHNVEFTAYYCFEYDTYAPETHPKWSVLTKDGIPLRCGMPTNSSNAKWGIPCMHTGYRDYALGQLKEVVEKYHPDSLFIDIFGITLCYCPTCREKYRKRFGYEMPETDEDMMEKNADLTAYLDDEAERLLDDVRNAVRAIDPTLPVSINFSAHYPKAVRDKLDYMFTEPWAGIWLSGAYTRDTSGGKPAQLGPGDISAVYNYQPDSIYELAAAEIAAQGCRVFMYSESMHYDGTLDHTEAQKVGKAYREVEKFEKYLTDRKHYADIAIVQSDVADTLHVTQPIQIRCVGRALVSGMHRQALLGAMQLCDYSKRSWCVVPELEMDFARMCEYKMILLPDLFYISDRLAADLRRYVENGGKVLFSGESGVYDRSGKMLPDFALADIMGCHLKEKDESYRKNTWCAYILQNEDEIWKYSAKTTPPVGEYTLKTSADGAKSLGEFIDPAVHLTDTTWVNWGYPLPGHENGITAIYENHYGKGTVLTMCFDFCTMASKDYIWTRDFFRGLTEKYIQPGVLLETEHMHTLEYCCYTRDHELIVHELSAMARLTGGDTLDLPGGTLKIDRSLGEVKKAEMVYPKNCEVNVRHTEKGAEIELLPVRIHAIYKIEV